MGTIETCAAIELIGQKVYGFIGNFYLNGYRLNRNMVVESNRGQNN